MALENVCKEILSDARKEAKSIEEAAEKEARAIVDNAKSKATQQKEESDKQLAVEIQS